MQDKLSRRDVLGRTAAAGLAAAFVAACGKSEKHRALVCTDTSSLPSDAVTFRTSPAVAYVDMSTDPNKFCSRCQHFLPPPVAGACGSCKVVKGPINPHGYCKLFAAKPT